MESATSVGFTNTANGDLTLVFVEPNATVKVDGTKYTANGDGIIQVSVSAGTHTITKANTANLYYMVYADQGGTVVTTTATTAAQLQSQLPLQRQRLLLQLQSQLPLQRQRLPLMKKV